MGLICVHDLPRDFTSWCYCNTVARLTSSIQDYEPYLPKYQGTWLHNMSCAECWMQCQPLGLDNRALGFSLWALAG